MPIYWQVRQSSSLFFLLLSLIVSSATTELLDVLGLRPNNSK